MNGRMEVVEHQLNGQQLGSQQLGSHSLVAHAIQLVTVHPVLALSALVSVTSALLTSLDVVLVSSYEL